MRRNRLFADGRGAAAVEMALITPLLLIILCGTIELGNYFMNEHTLIHGVRDGARWAARQNFAQFAGCNSTAISVPTTPLISITAGPPPVNVTLSEATKLMVRKGSLDASANDLLPNWTNGSTTFTVTMTCVTTAGGVIMNGIYSGNSVGTPGLAPAVLVTARLPYRPLLASFGWRGTGYFLNASQEAAVAGI